MTRNMTAVRLPKDLAWDLKSFIFHLQGLEASVEQDLRLDFYLPQKTWKQLW